MATRNARPAAPPSHGCPPADVITSKPDVTVTLACNNDCIFCPRTSLEHICVRQPEELDIRLQEIRAGSPRVILSGGEVTVLPGAIPLVARCRSVGFSDIALITNGRRMADPDFARGIVDAGLTEVSVSIYGLSPEVHDTITRTPGSLTETLQGLDNLLELQRRTPRLQIRVNTVLCATNAKSMVATLRGLAARGVNNVLVADAILSEKYPEALPHERVLALARAAAEHTNPTGLSVLWRGYPLCLFRDLPDIRTEPHQIDTTTVEPRDRDSYFDDFFARFTHVDACQTCGARARCPGVQRCHAEQCGVGSLAPIEDRPSGPEVIQAKRELAGFEAWPESGRLEVMVTTACQLACTYCGVALGARHASQEVLNRAVDLLLTSKRERLELQFFGGEPLLRREPVLATMARGAKQAAQRNKQLRFIITTNGLLLDEGLLAHLATCDCCVMFSYDGPADVTDRYRTAGEGRGSSAAATERSLRRLVESGVPYFVNMVLPPEAATDMPRRVRHLADLGVQTVQICYALAPGWTAERVADLCTALQQCAEMIRAPGFPPMVIQNLGSHAEPTVLSNDLMVDIDGTLYGDAALFGENYLPGLRPSYRIGNIFELQSFDGLRRSREQNLVSLRRLYPVGTATRALVEEQIALGVEMQHTLDRLSEPSHTAPRRVEGRDENPLHAAVLRHGLGRQARFMRKRPELLKLPVLMLENRCVHDCLFCSAKDLEPTPFATAAAWLGDNRDLGLRRLALGGNEPLAHPEVDRIIAEARACGFERLETLTCGPLLADRERARTLCELGLRGYALPLHAAEPQIHDAITQSPGSHRATLQAVDNLLALGASVHIHANLLRQNLASLRALEELVCSGWQLPFCVIPTRPKLANLPFAELMPRLSEVARAGVRSLVAFPLCVAARAQQPVIPPAETIADLLKVYVLDQPFVHPPLCQACTWRSRCSGTFQAYVDAYGEDGLRAQQTPLPPE